MLRCPECGRELPEVIGASSQQCPHCGHEWSPQDSASRRAAAPDPVGAAAAAFRFARRHYFAAMVLWIPAVVVDVAATVGVGSYEQAHGLTDVARLTDAQRLDWLGVAAPLLLVTVVLKLGLFAAIGGLVLDREGPLRASSALAAVVRRPWRLVALGLVLTLAYLVGVLLALVGFLVLFHWFQYAPVALADRGKGLGDAFDASRRFARERRAFGFTALVLFVVLAAFVVDQLLELGVSGALHGFGLGNLWTDALVGAVALWIVTPIVAILPASYWAVAAHAPPVEAPASAPAPSAFRTTKCPQCGTLIPYTATGEPVDVECPSCGRKGRVL